MCDRMRHKKQSGQSKQQCVQQRSTLKCKSRSAEQTCGMQGAQIPASMELIWT